MEMAQQHTVMVTGATGYIGGRLVSLLLDQGYRVRVLARDTTRLNGRSWLNDVEVAQGDVLKPETLTGAMEGVWAAYYLIHSMSGNSDFHSRDLIAARNFSKAVREQGVQRIIYLGGLGDQDGNLSPHLQSRQQTGEALRESGVPVTEFRAGVVVGSGSISFEMIRYLTERVPIMICPKWVYTRTQPIAIRDALAYLAAALDTPDSAGKIIDIGGADQIRYYDMMMQYARVRGLRRYIIPVPVLTPRLSSYWVHLVTPIPSDMAKPLILGLRNEAVADDTLARELFPQIHPMSYKQAVEFALDRLSARDVETSWNDSLVSSQGDATPVVLTNYEGMLIEQRQRVINAEPMTVYKVFTGLGGKRGWLSFNWAWRLRGLMDSMIGGVGFRRGRRHPDDLRAGDALDFWRVEAIEEAQLLRLRAEMKMPGRAWLQFKVELLEDNQTRLSQTAFFAPKGLFGLLYWYGLYPIHSWIFSSLIKRLGERSEQYAAQDSAVNLPPA
jgi:uncharacterized protein YbjT (DUF2867 family)